MPRSWVFARILQLFAALFCVACTSCRSQEIRPVRPALSATAGAWIAKDGASLLPVVVSPRATQATRRIANELASLLGRATGGRFEVTEGDGAHGIVVGAIRDFAPGLDSDALGGEGGLADAERFLVRSEEGRVLLLGRTELGASDAVFTLLSNLGFRWYFPGKTWEVVPNLPTLRANLQVTDRPPLLSRKFAVGFGFFDPRAASDFDDWQRHNRMGGSLEVRTGHAWDTILAQNRALFDAHPEYLALSNGRRLPTKLCVTNPEVQRIAIEYALRIIDEHPATNMVSMEESDGLGHCDCDRCRALGPPGNQPFYLANIVAKAIAEKYPGKFVGLLAYGEHSDPPTFPLEPNVFVQLTSAYNYSRLTHEELADAWRKTTKNLGFYDYFSVYQQDKDELPGGNGASVAYLSKQIAFYINHSALAVTAESGNNWGLYGRGYYLASRLFWDPSVDVHAVLEDFYKSAFHAGADAMRRYYERFDPGNAPLMSRELLMQGFQDVAQASKATEEDHEAQARLDEIKQFLHYELVRWDLEHSSDSGVRKQLVLEMLLHSYRTRRTYMNHWRAIWFLSSKFAREFDDPSIGRGPGPHPWQVDTVTTHDETTTTFARDLQAFPAAQTAETVFSSRLTRLAVATQQSGARAEPSTFGFAHAVRYALWSGAGEPLEFTVAAGLVAAYRAKAPAHWVLEDGEQRHIAEGRLPLDASVHPVRQPVPHPGEYYLRVDDSGAGVRLALSAGRPAIWLPERGKQVIPIGRQPRLYFYVPKGQKTVEYFWSGKPHEVYGPDGSLIQKVGASDSRVTIPVPNGDDGQVWYFKNVAISSIWFFNVPNCLSSAADALLVPEELVR